ncbi:MAG: hypothetical protein JST08_00315 [Actinobacteria bacterium]|nr:hypothetical protein [Actinomycetota bacterium]
MPLPDARESLLPQRAYLLAYASQVTYARRQAIADSRRQLDEVESAGGRHEGQLALLGLAGDAMQAIEDLGNFAAASMEGLAGLASYVKATIYRPAHVNDFYARLHKRDPAYFMALCGFEMAGHTMFDFYEFVPPLSARERTAIEAAERATAKLVGQHLVRLGGAWQHWRRVFHAYKHGALVANPAEVEIVDDDEVPIAGMVIWPRKRKEVEIGPHLTGPLSPVADQFQNEGELAIEVLEYLVELRLRSFDLITFDEQGNASPGPLELTESPWRFWMRTRDIDDEDVALLKARSINLEAVEVA